jgi:hypothetical protein
LNRRERKGRKGKDEVKKRKKEKILAFALPFDKLRERRF